MPYTPTLGSSTELHAVNELLAAIGESPLSSLDTLPPSGHTALHILRAVALEVQTEGYWFNIEDDYELTPELDGTVPVPANTIEIDEGSSGGDYVVRNGLLYDRATKTGQFTAPVSVTITLRLPWTDLPQAARWYITAMATERFCETFPGSPGVTDARNRNTARARAALRRAEANNGDYNILRNSSILRTLRRN